MYNIYIFYTLATENNAALLQWKCAVSRHASKRLDEIHHFTRVHAGCADFSMCYDLLEEPHVEKKWQKGLYVAWLCHVCWGLVLIRWRRVFMVWHCWVAFHSSLHGVQSERSRHDCCLFIHRAGNGRVQATQSKPQTQEHSSTLYCYIGSQSTPCFLLTQKYTSSHTHTQRNMHGYAVFLKGFSAWVDIAFTAAAIFSQRSIKFHCFNYCSSSIRLHFIWGFFFLFWVLWHMRSFCIKAETEF